MQIKKQTDQAIRILMHLSSKRQPMIGKELAGLVGVSEKYLPYIMQQLRRAGLVASSSGISGGYVLARSAKEITLLDVMAATSDEPYINCYSEGDKNYSRFHASDTLMRNYDIMSNFTTQYFGSLTIWDLSRPERLNSFYSGMEQINGALAEHMKASVG